jgi:hypothetical protein
MKRNLIGQFAPKLDRTDKVCLSATAFLLVVILIAQTIHSYKTSELHAYNPLLPKAEAAETPEAIDEILLKIAECESGGKQFYSDGRVVLNVNKDGSADVGMYQINLRYHGAELARMKLDVINSEEDNEAYAKHLYQRNGTADWQASKHCWDK